jgi:hypothetical protein
MKKYLAQSKEALSTLSQRVQIVINTTEQFQVMSLRFAIFIKYCANDDSHFTKHEFLKNLKLKRHHQAFQGDAHQFVLDHLIGLS